MIKRIDFKGNKKVGSSKLRMAFHLRRAIPLDKFKLTSMSKRSCRSTKMRVFAAAQMEPFTTTDATNHVTITFFITEGTQVLVDAVEISGVTAFKLNKIKKLMKTRRKKVFKQDVLAKDTEELPSSTKIAATRTSKCLNLNRPLTRTKTRITVSLTLEEGPLFHFGASKFTGNAIFQCQTGSGYPVQTGRDL